MQITQQQLLNLFWHHSDKINKESFLFFGKETFIMDEKTKLELSQYTDVNQGIANNNIFKIYDIVGEVLVGDKKYYFIVFNDE